jgi:RNA polymerase sigma-70 factor (ECF subfamily)
LADRLRAAHNGDSTTAGPEADEPRGGVRVEVDAVTDEVVAAAQQGDPDALRTVYRALAPAVAGYLRAKGVADPDAVTSDVFLALFGQLGRVRGGADGLRRLTFSIAHARMVDDHRARRRRPVSVPYEAQDDRRTAASAEDCAHANQSTEQVLEILDLLPDDQREVLTLRIVADLSVGQVAEIMGRSTGAVKQLQRRALIAVRQALAERQVTL